MVSVSDLINLQVVIFLLMACGFVLTRIGAVRPEGRRCLTDLLIDLILPCNIISSFMIKMNAEILRSTLQVLLMAFAVQILSLAAGRLFYNFADLRRKKVLQYATICSNAGFMGNPIVQGIYGAEGLVYASVYLIPLRFFMWTAGLSCFTSTSRGETVKKLALHPCINAVWIGFALMLTQWQPPAGITRTITLLSGCTMPVSMLIIGSILAGVKPREITDGLAVYYSFIRLIVIPLLTFAACWLFHFSGMVAGVSTVLAGMPAGSTTAILAEKYDGDAPYAAKSIFTSTLLSLFTIPLWCILISHVFH